MLGVLPLKVSQQSLFFKMKGAAPVLQAADDAGRSRGSVATEADAVLVAGICQGDVKPYVAGSQLNELMDTFCACRRADVLPAHKVAKQLA